MKPSSFEYYAPDSLEEALSLLQQHGEAGKLLGLMRSEEGTWESRTLLETGLRIAALGARQSGEIYLADGKTGGIRAIVPAPPVPSP